MRKWFNASQQNGSADLDIDQTSSPLRTPANCKQFGLDNFGNICYANSILQALYFCDPFRELVLQVDEPWSTAQPIVTASPPPTALQRPGQVRTRSTRSVSDATSGNSYRPSGEPKAPTLFAALRALFLQMSANPVDAGTISPRVFIDKLKELKELFRNTYQQDAHEFLNFLLNKIVEEIEEARKTSGDSPANGLMTSLNHAASSLTNGGAASIVKTFGPNATLVHKLFEGVLTSETRCLTCESVSSRDEAFLDLSIDIEKNSSVSSCLRQFSASEMLCQKNKFFCDSCCDLQEAEKRLKIKELPNVLALHLKRFKYQEDQQKYVKLAYRVAFPIELRLFNTVEGGAHPDRLFQLFAIVVHIGNGPHHGHYITVIKARGSWLVFDDESVEPIEEGDIIKYFGESNSGAAYVLYYQAVDIEPSDFALPYSTWDLAPVPSLDATSGGLTPMKPPGLAGESEESHSYSKSRTGIDRARPTSMMSEDPDGEDAGSTAGGSISRASSLRNGFLGSIRHAPSIKMRRPLPKQEGKREPPSPSLHPGSPPGNLTQQQITPIVPPFTLSPSLDTELIPEQAKSPEKRSGGWFKRWKPGESSSTGPISRYSVDMTNALPILPPESHARAHTIDAITPTSSGVPSVGESQSLYGIRTPPMMTMEPKEYDRPFNGHLSQSNGSATTSPIYSLPSELSGTDLPGESSSPSGSKHPSMVFKLERREPASAGTSPSIRPKTAEPTVSPTYGSQPMPPLPNITTTSIPSRHHSRSASISSPTSVVRPATANALAGTVDDLSTLTGLSPSKLSDSRRPNKKISIGSPFLGFGRRGEKTDDDKLRKDEEKSRRDADKLRKEEEKAKKKAERRKTDALATPFSSFQASLGA